MLKRSLLLGITMMSLCLFSLPGWAKEALCAEVKIQILQELTMERQGFEALMRITNSLDSMSLENVSVSVNFADENGNPVVATSNTAASDAAFFIRIDDTRDITGLQLGADGFVEQGIIAPRQVGELRWLIIPTASAAAQRKDGKLYFVGAQLRYTYGGKEELVDVAPDSIVVKPQPVLTLDYFLTQHIIGDDAFTDEIEQPEPYTLGVRISNTGFGYANAVKIESAQPTIIENELGLAIDFKILSSFVADQPVEPTLLINFGTIDPQAVGVGRWLMETNLAGKFTSFTASFTHADELGGELTSLLQETNAHFLVRDVIADLPGRDTIRDFLAYNLQQELYVYESENTGLNHAFCNHCAEVDVVNATLSGQLLAHSPAAGFSFAKVTDPFNGTRVLSRVVRSDGKVLHPQNAWLGKERAANNISFNYFVYVFDAHSTGEYMLHWGGNFADQPQPPVIEYLADRSTFEGGSVGFLVQASDPNNTLPVLSVQQLPTGASFVNQAVNNGVFQWQPAIGQAGSYTLTFIANDGTFTTERTMTIRVNPAYDKDGDGMDDEWEMEHFVNLDNDGTADTDGDGRSDLQEFLEGTDPKIAEMIPGTPQISAPIFDADTLVGAAAPYFPTLTVINGIHGNGIDNVSVIFEVYADEGLTELLASAIADEGNDTTSIELSALHMLEDAVFEDNRLYYWRARARDNTNASLTSAWVKSRFYINTANDAPTAPGISSPTDNSIVSDISPELIVTNATDIDRDRLYYAFVIYEESDLATPLAEVSTLYPGNNGQTRWRVPRILGEDKRYVWQARVTDEHGLATDSEWSSFLVSTLNHAPTKPAIAFPALLSQISELEVDNGLTLRVYNAADPERAPLVYYFELDKVNTFDSEDKQLSDAVAEGLDQTTWQATNLQENTTYFWRVRASDSSLFGPWESGEFTVSADNEAPSVPVLQNPVVGSVVSALRPLLEINPAIDPEGTQLRYEFELYVNAELTGLIAGKETTEIYWALDFDLTDATTYYWRSRAKDADGMVGLWSNVGHFTVTIPQINQPPQMSFVLPATDIAVENNQVLLQWVDSDPDSSATISLFRHYEGGAPELIVAGLSEDADGEDDQYVWDTTGLAAGNYSISAVISDEDANVTVTLCCVITIEETTTPISPVFVAGLKGHYYNYQADLESLDIAKEYIAGASPDATFISTQFDYGPGVDGVARNGNLIPFLADDAVTLSGNMFSSFSAIFHFTGKVSLAAGNYRFRVTADDGFSVLVNGSVVAQFAGKQSPIVRTFTAFSITESGLQDIEIIYWDAGRGHRLSVEISFNGGAFSQLGGEMLSHQPEAAAGANIIGAESVTYTGGLSGAYYGYEKADHDGVTISRVAQVQEYIKTKLPDALFTATYLMYGPGTLDLGRGTNFQLFLGADADSLNADPQDTSGAILTFTGAIELEAGTYRFRVRADDGYNFKINRKTVAERNVNGAATTMVHDNFIITEAGIYDVEFMYWDAGAGHTLIAELSDDDGASYQVLDASRLSQAIYGDDHYSFKRGDGVQTIRDGGGLDSLAFASSISSNDLLFSRDKEHLVISVTGTQDKVRITNWYLDARFQLEEFIFSNGQSLTREDVENLVTWF